MNVESGVGAPREVRRLFAQQFAALPGLGELLLCVSEVVTNAVLHASAPIRVVALAVRPGITRVEVQDGSPVLPVRRHPDPSSPTGRGLGLVEALCADWGVEMRPDGKTVWFEFVGTPG